MSKSSDALWTQVSEQTGRRALFRCACGTEKQVVVADVRAGRSRSCGCVGIKRIRAVGKARLDHGMEKSPEYRGWIDMRRRCKDPRRPDFKNYGGRGISVSQEWDLSFSAFYRDMGPRPEGATLDRSDNDGPYNKDNCYWATRKQQERNKRTSHIIDVRGETMTLAEASERFGIGYMTLANRINTLGWTPERAVDTPPDTLRASKIRRS